jgi:hypothetical protein
MWALSGNRNRAPPELIDRSRAREAFGVQRFDQAKAGASILSLSRVTAMGRG